MLTSGSGCSVPGVVEQAGQGRGACAGILDSDFARMVCRS